MGEQQHFQLALRIVSSWSILLLKENTVTLICMYAHLVKQKEAQIPCWQGNPCDVISSELHFQMWSIYSAILQGSDLCLRAIEDTVSKNTSPEPHKDLFQHVKKWEICTP